MQLQAEVTERKHYSRSKKISVRMATDAEGEQIARLVTQAGFTVSGIDWSRVAPFWLVAVMHDTIIGCIQVCLSIPIGRVEMLAIDKRVPPVTCGKVVEHLLLNACSTLRSGGAQMAAGLIPFEMKSYKRILKRRGCVSLGVGNEMARRL